MKEILKSLYRFYFVFKCCIVINRCVFSYFVHFIELYCFIVLSCRNKGFNTQPVDRRDLATSGGEHVDCRREDSYDPWLLCY